MDKFYYIQALNVNGTPLANYRWTAYDKENNPYNDFNGLYDTPWFFNKPNYESDLWKSIIENINRNYIYKEISENDYFVSDWVDEETFFEKKKYFEFYGNTVVKIFSKYSLEENPILLVKYIAFIKSHITYYE